MAVLIIALFVIVVVWGWYLMPKKTGAHKSSQLNVRGRKVISRGQNLRPEPVTDVAVIPVAPAAKAREMPVAAVTGTGASARRRRVRAILAGAALVSVAAALYTGSINWWLIHVAMDALLIIYYGLSLQLQESRATRAAPVVARFQEETRPTLRKVVGG